MQELNVKVRLMSLWFFIAVSVSAHGILALMEPGALGQLMSEEMNIGPGMLFFMALFWWIPLVMAFLSVTLRYRADRLANMVLGALFVVLNAMHLVEHVAEPSAHQVLLIGSSVVAAALIFGYALKWRKVQA